MVNLFMRMMSFHVGDGFPFVRLKPPIDPVRFGFNLPQEIMVALNMSSAGGANLHEGELALVREVLFEEPFNTPKALQDSFGVIHPLHSNTHECCFHAQLLEQVRSLKVERSRWVACFHRHFGDSNADRKRPNQGKVAAAVHGESFPFNSALQDVIDGLEEIIAVRLNVESDQIDRKSKRLN